MDIRKISIGPDYKSGAMHYLVGQKVLNGEYCIHLIQAWTKSTAFGLSVMTKYVVEVFHTNCTC